MDETFLDQKKTWILRMIPETETGGTDGGTDGGGGNGGGDTVPAWEMIEAGRYMPRRTRGSFPGRELG